MGEGAIHKRVGSRVLSREKERGFKLPTIQNLVAVRF